MSAAEFVTLAVAVGSIATAIATLIVSHRQGENAVRPVIVVLEKFTDNKVPGLGRSLYLVNMGQAVAINVRIMTSNLPDLAAARAGLEREAHPRTEIAVNRRAVLARAYSEPLWERLEMLIEYTDVNGTRYRTEFGNSGTHRFPTPERLPAVLG